MQQGWNLPHVRELICHSHEVLGATETTHILPKELKLVRGRDPYPRLPIIKGKFRLLGQAVHQAGIRPTATKAT